MYTKRVVTETCGNCAGSGRAINGSETCGNCDGKGFTEGFFGDRVCNRCDGSGSVSTYTHCGECGGSGYIKKVAMVCADCGYQECTCEEKDDSPVTSYGGGTGEMDSDNS